MSSEESYLINNKSDDCRSDSGSSGTYSFPAFYLRFDNSVGYVSGLVSGIFILAGVESKCDFFAFVMFIPIGVESKGGRPIKMFWLSNSCFSLQI